MTGVTGKILTTYVNVYRDADHTGWPEWGVY